MQITSTPGKEDDLRRKEKVKTKKSMNYIDVNGVRSVPESAAAALTSRTPETQSLIEELALREFIGKGKLINYSGEYM